MPTTSQMCSCSFMLQAHQWEMKSLSSIPSIAYSHSLLGLLLQILLLLLLLLLCTMVLVLLATFHQYCSSAGRSQQPASGHSTAALLLNTGDLENEAVEVWDQRLFLEMERKGRAEGLSPPKRSSHHHFPPQTVVLAAAYLSSALGCTVAPTSPSLFLAGAMQPALLYFKCYNFSPALRIPRAGFGWYCCANLSCSMSTPSEPARSPAKLVQCSLSLVEAYFEKIIMTLITPC